MTTQPITIITKEPPTAILPIGSLNKGSRYPGLMLFKIAANANGNATRIKPDMRPWAVNAITYRRILMRSLIVSLILSRI